MQRSKSITLMSLLVLVAILAAACAPAAAPAPQVVKETVVAKETVVVPGATQVVVVTPTTDPNAPKPVAPLDQSRSMAQVQRSPFPLYSKWSLPYDYAFVDSAEFNYQSIGSGGGIKQITANGTVDPAPRLAILKRRSIQCSPGLQMFPTVAGALDTVVVNLTDEAGTPITTSGSSSRIRR